MFLLNCLDSFDIIFRFIGDYDELTVLRVVCKDFKKIIKYIHITCLFVNEDNINILHKCKKRLKYFVE